LKLSSKLRWRLQEASGTFGYLRDVASVKVEAPRPVDVAPECAGMLAHLMLAQVRLRAVSAVLRPLAAQCNAACCTRRRRML